MKFIKIFLISFISINTAFAGFSKENLIQDIKKGGKLIFIRHAYAPGGGDPDNFDINDCSTQRNLSKAGKKQSIEIGNFFKKNDIAIENVYSSEWCRCKDTAKIAFNEFKQKSFLNSFFDLKFLPNKVHQMKDFKKFISQWDGKKNIILVTHYVVISEILNYSPSSGEIIVSNKDLEIVGNKIISLNN